MRTLAEIQDAVTKLGDDEKQALSLWLNFQTGPAPGAKAEQQLLPSREEALRDVDGGKGLPKEAVRKRVASWAEK